MKNIKDLFLKNSYLLNFAIGKMPELKNNKTTLNHKKMN
ncbi:Hypothetical Protein SLY_0654 [Strawberry lethal yellows phytoplasma (CPA) str. NZSb11]|uniref:Uncharacterized protein n=1 Tax=Strawberry lethal yellows phytoplasma (CPA) str. NZSb11 TaxID=980422 RepID=R4RMM3_PHYAS|nr:Hypothetical Protein SLY_0654 [Strawberry lethal yellows phytoplasma (CPA) str. NZSb11]